MGAPLILKAELSKHTPRMKPWTGGAPMGAHYSNIRSLLTLTEDGVLERWHAHDFKNKTLGNLGIRWWSLGLMGIANVKIRTLTYLELL